MKIIGIDPGLQHTGWGIIRCVNNSLEVIDYGVINTKSNEPIPIRLMYIHKNLTDIIHSFSPEESAIEETYVNKNYESSLKLAHARAASILTLSILGIPITEYSAKTIKKTLVGRGNADKSQISQMINFLIPGTQIKSADAADAVAIAICHSRFCQPIAQKRIANS
jgi:crossover junction endodeoxyribonuclease RuvC